MNGKFRIGIFGSAIDNEPELTFEKARVLGQRLAEEQVVLITGACKGIPYEVVSTAYRFNSELKIIGYSPAVDMVGQRDYDPLNDQSIYSEFIFVPRKFEFAGDRRVCFKYRNVQSVANSDAGICIAGRWGTLNEVTNLVDMGKTVGVLTSTGGVSDLLPKLFNMIKKDISGQVFFESEPNKLVTLVMQELKSKKKQT